MSFSNPNLLSALDSGFEAGTGLGNWVRGSGTDAYLVGPPASGFDGDYGMALKATAAGTVSTTNTKRIPVAVGAEHVARFLVITALSGVTVSTTITYYNAASGGDNLAEFTNGRVIPTLSRSIVAVCGEAPEGATHAELSVTADPLALDEIVYTDAFYFGVAGTIKNNFYDYNTQSFEQDASAWWSVNATVVASQNYKPPFGWGEWMWQATAVTDGDILTGTNETFPVVPGREYVGYTQVLADQTTGPLAGVIAELFWYDSENAAIGTPVANLPSDVPTNLYFVPVTVSGTAPAGAVTARVQYKFPGLVAGQIVYMDEAYFGPASNVPGNLLTYTEYSFEGNLPGLTAENCTVSPGKLNLSSSDGFYGLLVTPDAGSDTLTIWHDRLIPVTSGHTYKARYKVFTQAAGDVNASVTAIPVMRWYDEAQALTHVDPSDQPYTQPGGPGWVSVDTSQTRTAINGSAYVQVGVQISHAGSAATAYMVDQVYVVDSSPEYTVVADDATGSTTLTVHWAPASGAAFYTVYRVDEDGSKMPVRMQGDSAPYVPFGSAPFVVEDYEVPLATRVWYIVTWYDDQKAKLATLNTRQIYAPVLPNADYVWLKSPGNPANNVQVMMENPVTWSRTARTAAYQIVGRKNPIVVSGARNGRTAEVSILVWESSNHFLFDALLDSGLPALIQAMPGYGIEGNLYVSIGDVEAEPITGAANVPGWRWTLPVTEIDRPKGGIQGSALRTWQAVSDDYTTWDDVFDAYGTWADVLTGG